MFLLRLAFSFWFLVGLALIVLAMLLPDLSPFDRLLGALVGLTAAAVAWRELEEM